MTKKKNYKDIINGMIDGSVEMPTIDFKPQPETRTKNGHVIDPSFDAFVKKSQALGKKIIAIMPAVYEEGECLFDRYSAISIAVNGVGCDAVVIPTIDGIPVFPKHPVFQGAFEDPKVKEKQRAFLDALIEASLTNLHQKLADKDGD